MSTTAPAGAPASPTPPPGSPASSPRVAPPTAPRGPSAARGIEALAGGGGASTLRRALAVSPEIRAGLGLTLALAALTALGRVVVPLAVQQSVDEGLLADGGVDAARVAVTTAGAALVVVLTGLVSYRVTVRVFRATEAGLATLRAKAFDHVHRLAVLTQNTERRGSLVSRVTSDVDTVSTFLQTGGIVLLLSLGQLAVAVTLMLVLSWQLGLLVLACYVPLLSLMRWLQRRTARRYGAVRERYGDVMSAVSESVVGADTIRAHAAGPRTWRRIDAAIEAHRRQAVRAQVAAATTSALGFATTGLVTLAVVVGGTLLGLSGGISLGRLLALLFVVQLVTQPVLALTEVLNELQNALAGWRRVLAVLDTPVAVVDPGADGEELPAGPVSVDVRGVTFTYPGLDDSGSPRPPVLRGVDLHVPAGARVAVVGETGSGKTTLTRLITRLVDPDEGQVLLSGVDARRLRETAMHRRVVVVPQEGFLFDTTVGQNVRFGREGATDDDAARALSDLGLDGWVASLPEGADTPVGQLGEKLSAGERQLVALARAHLAAPDLLVLDEATSSVDPATEVRLQGALAGLLTGRTSVAIAHRLSTAEAADVVVVVDAGRVVEVGTSADLAHAGGPYSRLHAAWTAQHR